MHTSPAVAHSAAVSSGKFTSYPSERCGDIPGGKWVPFVIVSVYVCVLGHWQRDMRAQHTAGVDPFKATGVFPAALASCFYLLASFLGKRFMASRSAYDCKNFMLAYNVYQVLLNAWCVLAFGQEVAGLGEAQGLQVWGNRFSAAPSHFRLGFIIWVHYNNKYIELLDTLWMVLRKKNKQISFLHMYHHVLMIWAWLYVCKIACGGDAWFGAFVNSFVHVIMYSYYLLTQMGVACPWKRYLTVIQMAQFCVCMLHAAYVAAVRNMPLGLPLVQAFVMLNMLVLFSNFYRRSYGHHAARARGEAQAQAAGTLKEQSVKDR